MKKLNVVSKSVAKETILALRTQAEERDKNRAYEMLGALNDNYKVETIEQGDFGPVIKMDDLNVYPHRTLKDVQKGTVCQIVIMHAPETKTINVNGTDREIKEGTRKLVAYPID